MNSFVVDFFPLFICFITDKYILVGEDDSSISSSLGLNMIFYALTSAGPRGWCCNLSLKAEGLNSPSTGLADVNVSEKMFDRYYCV